MNNMTNWATPNGSDFRGAQAAATQQPHAERLDLFAEELPVQHDLKPVSTIATVATIFCIGGCVGTIGSIGSLTTF